VKKEIGFVPSAPYHSLCGAGKRADVRLLRAGKIQTPGRFQGVLLHQENYPVVFFWSFPYLSSPEVSGFSLLYPPVLG
jgi:hypothetical protein